MITNLLKSLLTVCLSSAAIFSFAADNEELPLYPRKVVFEEYTGIHCSFCVMGYAALEQLRENHPEDVINIAVHNYFYPNDPMGCAGYSEWEEKYISSAPSATVNRSTLFSTFSPSPYYCEVVYKAMKGEVPVGVEIEAEYADETHTTLNTKTTLSFARDLEDIDYGLSWVVTRDNMGPHPQHNAYSGGSMGVMAGFEDLPGVVDLIFNDVARDVWHWDGLQGSVPSNVAAGEIHTTDFSVNVEAPEGLSHTETYVVALLIDRSTGEIVNAGKCSITDPYVEGAYVNKNDLATVSPQISTSGGNLNISNVNGQRVEVYTTDGRMIMFDDSDFEISPANGIYIIHIGDKSYKVLVK